MTLHFLFLSMVRIKIHTAIQTWYFNVSKKRVDTIQKPQIHRIEPITKDEMRN